MGSKVSKEPIDKTLVIVGAGYAGAMIAAAADAYFNVVLISETEHFYHKIGSVRSPVTDKWEEFLTLPLGKLLSRGSIKYGKAVEIRENKVILDNNEVVTFDSCVLATGSTNSFANLQALVSGGPRGTTKQELWSKFRADVASSKNISIVGGGIVGMELLGEILAKYETEVLNSEKSVTLIHSGATLANSTKNPELINHKLSRNAIPRLTKRGATILLNSRVDLGIALPQSKLVPDMLEPYASFDDGGIELKVTSSTNDSTTVSSIKTDLVINTTGNRLNTDLKGVPVVTTNGGGFAVNEYLQVEGMKNVYAIGDCAATGDPKQIVPVEGQVASLIEVLYKTATDTTAVYEKYPRFTKSIAVVTLGPSDGIGVVNSMKLPNFVPKKVKAPTFFADKFCRTLNIPIPPVPKF